MLSWLQAGCIDVEWLWQSTNCFGVSFCALQTNLFNLNAWRYQRFVQVNFGGDTHKFACKCMKKRKLMLKSEVMTTPVEKVKQYQLDSSARVSAHKETCPLKHLWPIVAQNPIDYRLSGAHFIAYCHRPFCTSHVLDKNLTITPPNPNHKIPCLIQTWIGRLDTGQLAIFSGH